MFDFNNGVKSHMPFATFDPISGGVKEFCCIMVNGKWKIHQFKDGKWQRVNTGLPEDATECSPSAEFLLGIWHLSFIGGGAETDRKFRLYHISDLNSGVLPLAVCPADVGFIQKNRLVYASRHGPIYVEDAGMTRKITFTDTEYFYRISYDPFNPNNLLISGQTFAGDIFSRSYNLVTGQLFDIETDGVPAYKTAIVKGEYFYARQTGNGFEDREIVKAERIRFRPLSVGMAEVYTVPNHRKSISINEEFE